MTFTYDVFDRRIGKAVSSGSQNTQLWTIYDRNGNAYADYNGSTLATRYLYGNSVDDLFARYDGTNVSWYLTDPQGSVRQLERADGISLDQITYASFGQILSETSPGNGDRFKFTAREWDAEIGLYEFRARSLDPGIGRFVSEDPTGFQGGDMNLSRYVGNDPVNVTDGLGTGSNKPFKVLDNQSIKATAAAIENKLTTINDLIHGRMNGLQPLLKNVAAGRKDLEKDVKACNVQMTVQDFNNVYSIAVMNLVNRIHQIEGYEVDVTNMINNEIDSYTDLNRYKLMRGGVARVPPYTYFADIANTFVENEKYFRRIQKTVKNQVKDLIILGNRICPPLFKVLALPVIGRELTVLNPSLMGTNNWLVYFQGKRTEYRRAARG